MLSGQLFQFFFRYLAGPEAVHQEAYWFGHTDGIGELYFAFICKICGDNVFGNIPGGVCRTPVDLGRVFSRETSASMTSVTPICINYDFSSREA